MDSFRLRRSGHRWMAEAQETIHDYELVDESPKKILRNMELTFVDKCAEAGCKPPEEVVLEVQLGLLGTSTISLRAFVVKKRG
jgi:hypothetical protein